MEQITCNQGGDTEPIKIFFAKDIQQATNNYDPHQILRSVIRTVIVQERSETHIST